MNRLLVTLAITAAVGSLGDKLFDHHQVDNEQPWGFGRALRHCGVRYRSQGPEPDGEKSHQAEPEPSRDDFPRAHRGPQTTNDLLLQGYLGGEQWQERWGEKHGQQVHHTGPRRANRALPCTGSVTKVTDENHCRRHCTITSIGRV